MVMIEAKISELKSKLSAYVARVRRGETVHVLDRQTLVAKLVPADASAALSIREPNAATSSLKKASPVRLKKIPVQ
jgi:antitoxin (DNA-binding transcriptional repressor) of toxin-antitoxin stability system